MTDILKQLNNKDGGEISLFENDEIKLNIIPGNFGKTIPKSQPLDLEEFSEAPAVIYIIDENKNIKYLTNKFYLIGINRAMQERAQIVETFGGEEYLFFGEKAKVYTFNGFLLETKSSDQDHKYKYLWETSLTDLYNNVMRGSRLADLKYEAVLNFKNTILYGYVLSLNLINDASDPHHTAFSFNMLIRKQNSVYSNANELYTNLPNIPEQLVKDKKDYEEALKRIKEEIESESPEFAQAAEDAADTTIANGEKDPNKIANAIYNATSSTEGSSSLSISTCQDLAETSAKFWENNELILKHTFKNYNYVDDTESNFFNSSSTDVNVNNSRYYDIGTIRSGE